jgi:hypothetical protein
MKTDQWPDPLQPPNPAAVQASLVEFWVALAPLGDLLSRREYLLAAEQTTRLRAVVLALMLALNGIDRPYGTRHLNSYLSHDQKEALERTLLAPTVESQNWIGQAVALTVIYRWYAHQLVEKFGLVYPYTREAEVWSDLAHTLPAWPQAVTTD